MECEVYGSAVSCCAHVGLLVAVCVLLCCSTVCKGGLDMMERGIVILQAFDLTASRPRLTLRSGDPPGYKWRRFATTATESLLLRY